ncbi:MAG: phage tail protein [Actinomycetota bacterium]
MAVQRDHPYGQFNFLVEIDGIEAAGFSRVSGLDGEVDMIEYRTGNSVSTPMKVPGLVRYGDVTLSRGVIGSLELWSWFEQVVNGDESSRRTMVIILLGEEREPVLRWELRNARPVRHVSGPLDALGRAVAVEELVLAHEGLRIL